MSKPYTEIANQFEHAFSGKEPPLVFSRAIRLMKTKPDLCASLSAWDEMMWLVIEEYLNANGMPANDESFIYACALLEQA